MPLHSDGRKGTAGVLAGSQLLSILTIGFDITKFSIQNPVTAPGPIDQKFSANAYRAGSSPTSLGSQANEGCTGYA